jgi:hypothetical protein
VTVPSEFRTKQSEPETRTENQTPRQQSPRQQPIVKNDTKTTIRSNTAPNDPTEKPSSRDSVKSNKSSPVVADTTVKKWPALEQVVRNAQWPAPELTDATFAQWSKHIRPSEKQLKWRKIRWHTELEDAAAEAKRLNRPLLLWTMNGHPCGET